MLTFGELAIGDRFQKAGFTFTKQTKATAVDYHGGIATIGPDAWVDRITPQKPMPTFEEIDVGQPFTKAGRLFTKHCHETATDESGWVQFFNQHATVGRLTHIATKPDILQSSEPTHETRITRLTITPKKFPLFCEEGFNVELMDEAGGEFVRVSGSHEGELKIAPSEWPMLRRAIDRMIQRCREDDNEEN